MRFGAVGRRILRVVALLWAVLLAATAAGAPASGEARSAAAERIARTGFLENRGQADRRVAFYFASARGVTFVTREGEIVHSIRGPRGAARSVVRELPGRGRQSPSGETPHAARASIFRGRDPSAWRTQVPIYEAVSLGERWPGVRVRLKADAGRVEKLFLLDPGVAPDRIGVRVGGVRSLRVAADGRLIARAGRTTLSWSAPVAYQQIGRERRPVAVAYVVSGHRYGFRLGEHDPSLGVTIDPILQATYLGGFANDYAFAVALHPATGDILVAGRTESPDFPGVGTGPQPEYGGGSDEVFVARFNADLTRLEQASYFGGSDTDLGFAIAAHPVTGEIYVAGQTCSLDLPGTREGERPRVRGICHAFVARFDPTLTRLERAAYVGGSRTDGAYGMAITPDGREVILTGYTASLDFPAARGGAREAHGPEPGYDAFVARLDASLDVVRQSTYLGGGGNLDVGTAVAVDPATGDIFAAGQTDSLDFPGTSGGAQAAAAGAYSDGFVARLDPTLTRLRQATYLGGSYYTNVIAMAIHPRTGEVFAAGQTSSPDLPGGVSGAPFTGGFDGFVARLEPGLTRIGSTAYFGGSRFALAHALTIHPVTGDVYLGGETSSTDIPGRSSAAQPGFGGGFTDGFVVRFDESLTTIESATYIGGGDLDRVYALAVAPGTGELLVAGETRSSPFPATSGAAQPHFAGGDPYGGDAFVARLTPDLRTSRAPLGRTDGSGRSRPRVVPF
jgi:hypothetical protein